MFWSFAVFACRDPDPAPTGPTGSTPTEAPATPRIVVEEALSLHNPQQDPVVWPIWGAAFETGEDVTVALDLAGDGAILLAGPGRENNRTAVLVDGAVLTQLVGAEEVDSADLGAPPRTLTLSGGGETLGGVALDPPLDGEIGIYVALDPGETLEIRALALSQPLPVAADLGTPLRALSPEGLEIGTAIDIWPPRHDLAFEALLGEQFDLAAPTELYWPTTRGEDQDYFFVPADLTVNYARVHDQVVTGMFLVWDFALPRWVKDLETAEVGPVYDDHVTTLVGRYRGRVDAWVVVNEAIWGPGEGGPRARLAETFWYEHLGPTYIERAFTTARAADPTATLLYNETGAEMLGEKSDFLYDLMVDLLDRDVPVDGVGFQFHVRADDPPDIASVVANFERFAALGLSVWLTEIDVSLDGLPGTDADNEQIQATIYADLLGACQQVQACRGYTMFGFSDRYSWDALGDASPLVFDDEYRAKPAYFAIQSALAGAPDARLFR